MLNKISTADARKKFSSIVNRVTFGKESFVLKRRGGRLAVHFSVAEHDIVSAKVYAFMDCENRLYI